MRSTFSRSLVLFIGTFALSFASFSLTLAAPLNVSKTDDRETAAPGDILTYKITISNPTRKEKKEDVKDYLPSLVTFLSASDGGAYKAKDAWWPNGQTVTWKAVPIPPLGSKTLTLTVQVKVDVSDGTVIENKAKIGQAATGFHNAIDTTTVKVPEPNLNIIVQSLGTSDTAVKNAKNVNVFRFKGHAEGEDILLTRASFTAQAGSLSNGQNYRLWVDTDSSGTVDTVLESGVSPQGNPATVTFDNLGGVGFVILKDQLVLFEVHTDIASSLTGNQLQVKFDTASVNYIEAEELDDAGSLVGIKTDGVCAATCQITVTTVPSILYKLVDQGNLYVTKSSPAPSRQLLGGALGDAILFLGLRAEDEAIDVTALRFEYSSHFYSIDALDFFLGDSTTRFARATTSACAPADQGSYLCVNMLSQQLVIPEGSTANIRVHPHVKSDVDGGMSGDIDEIMLDFDEDDPRAVEARGISSSNVLLRNDSDTSAEGEIFIGTNSAGLGENIQSEEQDIVMSKIVKIENVNPDANGTNVPVGTNKRIAEFRFTAASNSNTLNGSNKANPEEIVLDIVSSNMLFASNSFDLYNKSDQTQKIHCTETGTGGSFFVLCSKSANTAADLEIGVSSAITLVLEADILSNQVSATQGSMLQVSFTNFSDRSKTVFGANVSDSHIHWKDTDNDGASSFRWTENENSVISSTRYEL